MDMSGMAGMSGMSGMDGMDMSMGSMSSIAGIPPLLDFPKIYYAVVGVTVGIAAIANLVNIILFRQRLAAARNGLLTPSKPKSWFFNAFATVTAIMREASSATLDPVRIGKFTLPMPTVGRTFLVLANLMVLIVLCFVGFPDLRDRSQLENIGYRTGFVSLAQIPLLFLLAGKKNIIGLVTGISYERLNWLHRWCARTLLLTSTIHFGYWLGDWWPYGSFVGDKFRTDPLTQRGLIAWAFLVWIVFSSMSPVRGWNYQFFVVQHLVSFALFIGFVYIHTPSECHIYIWIPVGLYFFDRLVRAGNAIYTNVSFFHPKQRREGTMKGLWACRAEFTPLPHNTTRITISNPPISWQAGQHVFLSCHSVLPLQSHPFTISSIPADGKMEFHVKSDGKGTKRFFTYAEKQLGLPTADHSTQLRSVAIEGPYGSLRPLRQFDSVILFAGSTGATFTMPLLRDIVAGWVDSRDSTNKGSWLRPNGVVTRHIRFVWVLKSRGQLSWFSAQLSTVINDVARLRAEGLQVDVDMSVYCTCDDSFTEEHKSLLASLGWGSAAAKNSAGHGKVEEIMPAQYSSSDEKSLFKQSGDNSFSEREVSSRESIKGNAPHSSHTCGPNGECCCKTDIEDEDAIIANSGPCCCGPAAARPELKVTESIGRQSTRSSSTDTSSIAEKMLLNPNISLFTGRPTSRNIIRKSLEQAHGESAVVVCGPQGLVDDVRCSVVKLSDERAVHKGTGAQGIYLHCEAFNY